MSAPTVARIEGVPFRLPLTSALAWGAHSALSAAEHVLVRDEEFLVDVEGLDPALAATYACSGVTVFSAVN